VRTDLLTTILGVSAVAASAVGLFTGTNIDDMVVLAVLNASSRAGGRPKRWQIWAGQYAGTAILVALSLAAGRGLRLIPEHWIWLLGLLPLSLGVRKLIIAVRARRAGEHVPRVAANGVPGVIGLTVANGGDNFAAYTPVFATIDGSGAAVTIAVFAICVALWCLAGSWLVSHRRVIATVERWGHWIIPFVYFLIGLNIFWSAGAFSRLP
jgi:cadmium resistance protein CadD (predicted permease)